MTKTLESRPLTRVTWLTQVSTSPSTYSSSLSSGSNFFCISLFNRNFHLATADSAASSKSMSSSSIKLRRVFVTLRCIASIPGNSLVDDTPAQRSSGEVKRKKMVVLLDRNFMARVPENVIQHSRELNLRKKIAEQQETISLLMNAMDLLLDQIQ